MKTKIQKLTMMTPDHPQWIDFINSLMVALNYQEKNGRYKFACGGGDDNSRAKEILEKMGGIDVPGSLTYFRNHGGYCDCEIVYNVFGAR